MLNQNHNRISWDEYFMNLAFTVANRSTCIRRSVGCVMISKDHRILTTGYNGAPTGITNCCDTKKCIRQELNIPSGTNLELCRASHAEMNAIVQAATSGVSIKDSICYCTTMPCVHCARLLINCSIKTIYYSEGYPQEFAKALFNEAKVELINLNTTIQSTI